MIFKGLKVIELSSVLAGPAVGMFFSELGAEVIKVENQKTGGDVTRSWKLNSENPESTVSAYFSSVNYGKTYLDADLKSIDGQKTVHRHNHNGLNHLRSMKFGLLFYELIKYSNEDLFKKYIIDEISDTNINEDKIFFCIFIGCMFTAILRINEEEASGNLKQITDVKFGNVFENINRIGWTSAGYSYWHFSSSIFYLVLMKKSYH